MQIIPVIDILKGTVVHACRGRRDDYRPIRSRLCSGSGPEAIIAAFLELYPFPEIYIADLDAIEEKGSNDDVIGMLSERFPDVTFWIDRGSDAASCNRPRNVPVIGTETGLSRQALTAVIRQQPQAVLSLDFNADGLIGDKNILKQKEDWPQCCIVMALHRVGSGEGPDMELLRSIRERAPKKSLYAAGGLRDEKDLTRLIDAGATGALLASALHNGTMTRQIIEASFRCNSR
ncbi:MAG: HisA/HisF-related TIM barrel protein [Gammaproteobacteria bacterium]